MQIFLFTLSYAMPIVGTWDVPIPPMILAISMPSVASIRLFFKRRLNSWCWSPHTLRDILGYKDTNSGSFIEASG